MSEEPRRVYDLSASGPSRPCLVKLAEFESAVVRMVDEIVSYKTLGQSLVDDIGKAFDEMKEALETAPRFDLPAGMSLSEAKMRGGTAAGWLDEILGGARLSRLTVR